MNTCIAIALCFPRRFSEAGERELADSRVIRRLAQMSIYTWLRTMEWATKQSESETVICMAAQC